MQPPATVLGCPGGVCDQTEEFHLNLSYSGHLRIVHLTLWCPLYADGPRPGAPGPRMPGPLALIPALPAQSGIDFCLGSSAEEEGEKSKRKEREGKLCHPLNAEMTCVIYCAIAKSPFPKIAHQNVHSLAEALCGTDGWA